MALFLYFDIATLDLLSTRSARLHESTKVTWIFCVQVLITELDVEIAKYIQAGANVV